MAIFNSFAVPLEYVIKELETVPSYQTLDLIINILFIFDILIGFRTTFFDALGNEIRSPTLIAKKYIKGMFFVDFFSSIPYRYVKQIFKPIENISFLKILKIARISRFGPFVQRLELNAEDKAVSLLDIIRHQPFQIFISTYFRVRLTIISCPLIVSENRATAHHPRAHSALPGLWMVYHREF